MTCQAEYKDIVMKNNCDYKNYFSTNFRNYAHKRNYLDMLNSSNSSFSNSRIENYKLLNKDFEMSKNYYNLKSIDNSKKKNLIKEINCHFFEDFSKIKRNLLVKNKREYDEERERKIVENYYRFKNAELNKLRFGT